MRRRGELVRAEEAGEEHAPPALVDRGLAGPALDHRAPVRPLHVHVDARLLQHVGTHLAQRLQGRQVGRDHHHCALALVASGGEVRLHASHVALACQH